MIQPEEFKKLIAKAQNAAKDNQLDLSMDEDLSIAIMNLVSIEEHFFFTGVKTEKSEYFELLRQVREMRKELLKEIIKDYEGEVWCISKHLLAASMRLMEVGTKLLGKDKREEAEKLFKKAYDLYSLFWGINLKIVDITDVKKIESNQINKNDKNPNSLTSKLGELVKKLIDCCKE